MEKGNWNCGCGRRWYSIEVRINDAGKKRKTWFSGRQWLRFTGRCIINEEVKLMNL